MKKWLLVVLLLLLAFWAGGRFGLAQATDHALALADTVTALRDTATGQRAALDSSWRVVDSLGEVVDSVTKAGVKTRWRSVAAAAKWDTLWLPGDTASLAEVRRIGTAAIEACHADVTACEVKAAKQQERGDSLASVAQQADSLARVWERAADASTRQADAWRKVARGPLLSLAAEATLATTGDWQAAGDLTVGHGHLRGLVRVDVGPGQESCEFTGDAYACTTATTATLRAGARYTF